MPTAPSPRPTDVAIVVVCAVALAVTVFLPWWGRDRAAAAEVVLAIEAHRALVQPGDVVLIHPPWRDDVVTEARRRVTLPRGALLTETFTRRHGDPWPAMVVVAEGVHPWPASLEARRVDSGAAIVVDGDVRFFRLPAAPGTRKPPEPPTTTTTTPTAPTIPTAPSVTPTAVHVRDASGTRTECPWDARLRRHVCVGLASWMTVGSDTLVIGGRREACTWSHPISGGELVVDFGLVDVARGLRLQAALSNAAADNPDGAAVAYTLIVDDVASGSPLVVHHRRGFEQAFLPPRPGQATVRLVVTTTNDGQRHTCFRLTQEAR